jgi:predicted Zn-dependent peptidase
MNGKLWIGGALAAAILLPGTAGAVKFSELESQVKEFTLPNGLTFLVLERHDAPVFSFRTYVNAGGVDEVPGITGVAHMFEHMAFKGTPTIGTSDYDAERKAMAEVDQAWNAYAREDARGYDADSLKLAELRKVFEDDRTKAQKYVVSNDFAKIIEENGGQGLNASTGLDRTVYLYSLPSNRLELWARMEGERLTRPVMREFYVERDVVIEERRFQESSPTGRLFDDLIMTGFLSHPYGTGVIGYPSDLQRITRQDALDFFHKYYVASNMAIALVGDVDFDQVKKLAVKYFSDVPAGPKAGPVRTREPRHDEELRVTRDEDAQPVLAMGYMVPGRTSPNWFANDLLGDILARGRSSRLYDRLVKKDKIASQAGGGVGFPGEKYPNMLIFFAMVASGATPGQVESVTREELQRFVDEGPTDEELAKVKSMSKASFIRGLRSNSGLAGQLVKAQMMLGDWHQLFRVVDQMDAVTKDDIRKAAAEALRPGNAVVAMLRKPTS